MSSDLFEDARAVRDATMAEFDRIVDPDIPECLCEGYRVGIHLASIVMTASAQRLGGLSGPMQADGLMHFVAVAIAQALSYGATAFRPMHEGKPIPPSANLQCLASLVLQYAVRQVEMQEQGLQDFMVPFEMNADGSISVKAFDFQDMLNKGGA